MPKIGTIFSTFSLRCTYEHTCTIKINYYYVHVQAQVKNEASKPKPQNVASVDNAPLVSKGEKRPIRRQRARAHTSVIPPISEAIDKLEEVNAKLLAQKEQQIDELNEVKAQLLAQKAQELQQINELKEVKAQLAKTEQELQHLKPPKVEQVELKLCGIH